MKLVSLLIVLLTSPVASFAYEKDLYIMFAPTCLLYGATNNGISIVTSDTINIRYIGELIEPAGNNRGIKTEFMILPGKDSGKSINFGQLQNRPPEGARLGFMLTNPFKFKSLSEPKQEKIKSAAELFSYKDGMLRRNEEQINKNRTFVCSVDDSDQSITFDCKCS